jgi:YidC/Oxa1 family membrane protein insertase
MLGAFPWSPLFQALLNAIGVVLAWLYDQVGNFGVSIILLTIAIRFILLPLGMRQIKSMQAMQAIQPKVKEIQKKFKADKQRQQEETMKLYREHGVSPFGSCLPMLLQFPLLVAMYAVVRPPQLVATSDTGQIVVAKDSQTAAQYKAQVAQYEVHNNHLPIRSQLFDDVITHHDLGFLWMNLQCSAGQAGTQAPIEDTNRKPVVDGLPIVNSDGNPLPVEVGAQAQVNCGGSTASKIPYLVFIAVMVGTTFYQQRQMQKVSPPGATNPQTQTLMYLMPALFGFWGWLFPAGLLVYWTTANIWQIGQQYVMFRAGHIGPDALEKRRQELENRPATQRKGLMGNLMERADQERRRRTDGPVTGKNPATGGSIPSTGKNPSTGKPKPASGSRQPSSRRPSGGKSRKKKPGGSSGSSDGKGRPKR